jgi:hypothetical protein
MSAIGYYRYKISPVGTEPTSVTFYKDAVLLVTHNIQPVETCGNWRQLKWLDKNGQYRFFPFIEMVRTELKPSASIELSPFIESLFDQSKLKTTGKSSTKTLQLRATNVTKDQLSLLAELNESPCIYLYVGDKITDTIYDWIQVTCECDNFSEIEKHRNVTFNVKITFIDNYTIIK